MAKKQREREQAMITLDYTMVKRDFEWISTIGPARGKMPGTKYTMRITFNHESSRKQNFDEQRRKFDKFIKDFYAKMNNHAITVWERDCAIVAVY